MPVRGIPKGPEEIRRVRFSTKRIPPKRGEPQLVRIGGNNRGDIYVGSLWFRNGKRQRVAIKRFKHQFMRDYAERGNAVIRDLAASGVRIPKTAYVKLPRGMKIGNEALAKEEYVQITQLFGSSAGSKIVSRQEARLGEMPITKRAEIIKEYTKIANAGYKPATDVAGALRTRKGIETIPIDLDAMIEEGRTDPKGAAERLATIIGLTAKNETERDYLFNAARIVAGAELVDELGRAKIRKFG